MALNMRGAIDDRGTQARNIEKLGIATIIEGVVRFRTQGHCSGCKKNRTKIYADKNPKELWLPQIQTLQPGQDCQVQVKEERK